MPEPDAPPSTPLQAWQVLLGGICALVLTIGLARFAYTPLLPQMHAQAGLGVADGGLLAAINYAGYMSGALLAAWIESPTWRQRLYSWGLPLALLITALMGWSTSFAAWALSRYVGGLCGAAGMLLGSGLVQGWLMRSGHRPELGLYFIGLGLGIVVSALGAMGMTHAGLGWAGQWQGFALIGLAFLLPAWLWRPPAPPMALKPAAGAAPNRRWMALMVAAYFCAGWGFVINATFTVAIVEKQPLLAGQGPWAWLLVGLAATPAVFVWDRVARRTGDVGALLIAFGLQIVGVLLPALADGLAAALLGALLYGATFIGIVSLTLALVGRRSPANPGKAMARLTLSYGVAQVSAPALTGRMVEASGSFDAALWLTAAVLAAGMLVLLAVRREVG
ncbi:YbfB/YjiJ family MFS transporter [Roseateles saccharophilus]|uniref:Putative MFS family arabinose efflux permease n=1 Tax=Roseateles saccharophilus TaxID=304 RepID=A0A4R3VEF6_ROSSA|nr:YbfB/YjiJ family MFS transporter [Roseateles saccharophilus]MDG0834403.1 YbfB/YjiJ family MFS transporter [Roseateles saccharophilus]TCV02009.1 putative MFS family arabinose efflux permease [Roseateles saccharophilus]